ncbi:uncharacterized protein LOC127286902 isoform X2 [Leptopilina boulardi]|uniref:uncharacterized protein LOC127286902 isoform X2 n=1 Tax=Leptopilina boulardi TaxID=63433 RepID=UPI0021F65CDF|nr:uncharacterized protein LOC127286902 isoform X2 [Leptopilina boulardi]
MWNRKVFIRIVEVLLCVACVVALRVTDDESKRVFHYLRNRSLQWSLLNNVTWGVIGQAFATVTCGGYLIITIGLLIAAATGELRGRKTECFFLGLGVIFFGIVGGLSLASLDSVPQDLIDNAAVLGTLCLLTALVFIADLLMSSHQGKKKHDATQTFGSKETGSVSKRITIQREYVNKFDSKSVKKLESSDEVLKFSVKPMTMMTVEKETKIVKSNGSMENLNDSRDSKGQVTNGFKKSEGSRLHDNLEGIDYIDRPTTDRNFNREEQRRHSLRLSEVPVEDQNKKFQNAEKQTLDYPQNVDNYRRHLRDSEEPFEIEKQRMRKENDIFRTQDIYQRPVDELDTPRFPATLEKREPIFAKIVNPGVKIMRVDRDVEETIENYRFSDSSQYDNVPTRMFSSSNGFGKKNRDAVFSVPRPSRLYKHQEKTKDEIEMLEEYFNAYRTASIGTQTGNRLPSSPNDPGYVRHTASNWPQNLRIKTPGGSPERDRV